VKPYVCCAMCPIRNDQLHRPEQLGMSSVVGTLSQHFQGWFKD
jgi:hypothetical protein